MWSLQRDARASSRRLGSCASCVAPIFLSFSSLAPGKPSHLVLPTLESSPTAIVARSMSWKSRERGSSIGYMTALVDHSVLRLACRKRANCDISFFAPYGCSVSGVSILLSAWAGLCAIVVVCLLEACSLSFQFEVSFRCACSASSARVTWPQT